MLKQPIRNTPYIAVFKTGPGEEFIAKVVEETSAEYSVEKPLCMVATQQGFQFAPFIMMADMDKAITIPKPVIVAIPASKLQSQYEQATSSIVLAR
jgi:hypothetical protein